MVPENALKNATLAMELAEEWLDVPQVKYEFTEYQVQPLFLFLKCN